MTMALPGGAAAKLGNRYEKWWTLSEFVRLLRGETDAIRIEDPSVEKAEFVVTTGSGRELHQVKRSHPSGKWSLAALRIHGLLEVMGRQLTGNEDRFVFTSGSEARELCDLCAAAKTAESLEEFELVFLAAKGRKENFKTLLQDWDCEPATAVNLLARIDVRTIDEPGLESAVRWALPALFLATPRKVVDALRGIAEDTVQHTLTRDELVEQLAERGYRLRRLTSPASASVAIRAVTNQFLDGARSRLIQQRLVPREAAKTLLARLGEAATDCVLTGRAGSGKTACIVEAVTALRKRGVPVLAFRLDRFLSVSTTAELGRCLELEESPVLVLAEAAAAGRPAVLIVDQLDAASTSSGRISGAFDLVEQLLLEARGMRPHVPIHVVVVCREFDWANDPRLRRLIPSEADAQNLGVGVAEFTVEQVKEVLTGASFHPRSFSDRQLRILQLPQNLSLFLEADFDVAHAPAFGTATEIFDRYWDAKRQLVSDRAAHDGDRWMEVIETVCDEMTSSQRLSVAKEKLDRFPRDYMRQLASEGVLTFDGRSYGFGHESFFDYCFARVFVAREEPMAAFLKASPQHLFRRTQVRQVLAYLREASPIRYAKELRDLLADNGVRPHLKDLVFTLLADIREPTDDEWAVWETWIEPTLKAFQKDTPNADELSALAWRRFFMSRSWFTEVDRRGMIERWLGSENDRIVDNVAVDYLRIHQRHNPDRVAALLEPYAERAGWALRLQFLMVWAELGSSRRFFDLFLRLVDNGVLDKARGPIAQNSTFSSLLYGLRENRLDWVAEVTAHRLRRRRSIVPAHGGTPSREDLFGRDPFAGKVLLESANEAPVAFVEHMLPVVLEISDSAVTGDTRPKRDAVWSVLVKTKRPDGEEASLEGLAGALAALAGDHTVDLDNRIAELRRRGTHVANHLLLALYAGGAGRYADAAVSLLCDEPWRLQCGFSDNMNWCAVEMIRAVVPHCTAKNRKRVETMILDYVAPYERTASGYKQYGRTRFCLLSAIPAELRSARANVHFGELERKFGEPEGEPQGVEAGWVKSPIEKQGADKMTDDQWLSAVTKHGSDNRIDFSGDELKGGASQLAQVLEERVKEQPDRFARLSLRFPADVNSVYMERTLCALAESSVEKDLKLRVCRKAFAESRGGWGEAIADVLRNIETSLPEDAVEMLHWLAVEDDGPVDVVRMADAGGRENPRDRHRIDIIETNGINTTRGRAARAIQKLILADVAYIDKFRSTLDLMIRDPSPAVRSCVAGTLRAIGYHDSTLAVTLFRRMDLSEDSLLGTSNVYRFVLAGLAEHFDELRPIVERMLHSSEADVQQAGACLAGAVALHFETTGDLAAEALDGSPRQRLGIAQVAAETVAAPEHRARIWSEEALVMLFKDADVDVRQEAASCFRYLSDEAIDQYGELIASFVESPAFEENSSSLVDALDHARGRLPGITCTVCQKFLDRFAEQARDFQTHRYVDGHTVAKLVFRTYQQHQNDAWTERALDLIDRLCLEGTPGTAEEFERFER